MICNLGVVGSIPSIGSKLARVFRSLFLRGFDTKLNKEITKKKREKGEYQSGQMGQTVNLLVYTFGGSNPSSPTRSPTHTDRAFSLKKKNLNKHPMWTFRNAEFSSIRKTCKFFEDFEVCFGSV